MVILCDTSSILMLLRFAPDMFIDSRFECKTIREVHDEIVQTPKFKPKYPWAGQMRAKLRPIVLTDEQKKTEAQLFSVIQTLNDNGTINSATGKYFDLSPVDKKVISHCLTLGYSITSEDKGIIYFLEQEFSGCYGKSISPLEIIVGWLEKKLITWDTEKQKLLESWRELNEPNQPPKAIKRFKELTGFPYAGF